MGSTEPTGQALPDVQTVIKSAKTFGRDLLERTAATFVQGFIGGVVVTQPLDASMWYAAVTGGVAAVLALVKGIAARARAESNSASLARGV